MAEKIATFRAAVILNISRDLSSKRKGLAISKIISMGYKGIPKGRSWNEANGSNQMQATRKGYELFLIIGSVSKRKN